MILTSCGENNKQHSSQQAIALTLMRIYVWYLIDSVIAATYIFWLDILPIILVFSWFYQIFSCPGQFSAGHLNVPFIFLAIFVVLKADFQGHSIVQMFQVNPSSLKKNIHTAVELSVIFYKRSVLYGCTKSNLCKKETVS